MAERYWTTGGSGVWTDFNNWAQVSGGPGVFPAPTTGDNVYFDGNSGNPTVTVQASATLGNFSITGPCTLTLGQNLSLSVFTINAGSFNTSTFNLTAFAITSSGNLSKTLTLGSGTHTFSGSTGFTTSGSNFTFNAGTSSIVLTSPSATLSTQGLTFNNVSFTSTLQTGSSISGANTFNNLTVAGRSSVGINRFSISENQIISGTLTLSAGTNAAARTFLFSDVIGTQRQLQVNSFASTNNLDFRDIAITGTTVNGSALSFGNCQGNSGISFPAGKTVWWRATASANWNATTAWADSNGGTASITNFPLAQDTVIFPSSPTAYPTSGNTATINAAYNIGTIDMSARTSATMTLATGTQAFAIYGDLKTGSGVTYTGTGSSPVTFAGRTTQNITSASKVFTRPISIDSPGGTVVLTDDFDSNNANESYLVSGTWNLNGYTTTIRSHLIVTGTNTREIAFGGANLVIGILETSGTVWDATVSTNLTLSGGGTITLQTAGGGSAKTFAGGNYQNYPTVDLGANVTIYGTGLTITGSNKFQNITNSTLQGGTLRFTGGQTNEFVNFSAIGVVGNPLVLSSTNTTQTTLKKPTTWFMGANSINVIGNTGLTFTAGGGIDYLQVSYINGIAGGSSYTDSIMESITVGDLNSTLYAYLASLYENFSPDDSSTQQASYLSPINEDFSPADAATITVQIYVNQTEDFSPADLSALSFQFFVSQSEDTSVLDTPASTAQLSVSQTEDFLPEDISSLALLISIGQTENIASADNAATVVQFVVSRAEGFTSADVASVNSAFFQSITENTSAADLATAVRNLFFALNEDVSSANAQTISLQFLQLVQENLNLQEFFGVPVDFKVSLVENFNMLDGPFVSGGWIKVDDSQTATWQNVANTQTPTWTDVNDAQTPG
jgi:hypothetical protein